MSYEPEHQDDSEFGPDPFEGMPPEARAQFEREAKLRIRQQAIHTAARPFLEKCQAALEAETFTVLNTLRDAAPCDMAYVAAVAALHRVTAVAGSEFQKLPTACTTILWRYFAGLWSQMAALNEASLKAQDAAAAKTPNPDPR